jgi:cation diffusion facilitator family transporter
VKPRLLAGGPRRRRGAVVTLLGASAVLAMKLAAFAITGSVALLSDAAESVVNLVAAGVVLFAMRLAEQPADLEHPYGHTKAEDLSSALEGGMILVAALMIVVTSAPRFLAPEPLTSVGVGASVALAAALINSGLAWWLGREAKRVDSAALDANARHLWTDVWTSLGVLAGVGLVVLTGQPVLDPLIAVVVALNISRTGMAVLARSMSRLLDERLPPAEERLILGVLDADPHVQGYHRLRTRRAGAGRFAEVDVFVDPRMTVADAHEVVVALENAIHARLPNLLTTIHVEPVEAGRREGAVSPQDEFRG